MNRILIRLAAAAWFGCGWGAANGLDGQEPAGEKTPASKKLVYPLDIVVDENDVLYVADRNQPGVWKSNAGRWSILFQASKNFRTPLNAARCVGLDKEGRLLAGDSSTFEIYRFENGKPQPLTQGKMQIPMDIVVNQAGEILVSDLRVSRIWKVSPQGGKVEVFAVIPAPTGMHLDQQDRLWVISRSPQPLFRVSPEGKVETLLKERTFQFPNDIVVDEQQTAYISDGYAKAIWKMAPGEQPQKWVVGEPFVNPVGLAWRGKDLLVADSRAAAVFQVNPNGEVSPLP